MPKARAKFSEEPKIQGPAPRRRRDLPASPRGKGLFFLVMRDLEHDGVHYFPSTHHLVTSGRVPERVPSMGAKSTRVGDNTVPVDASGYIDASGLTPGQIFALCQNRTIQPLQITKQLEKLLADGARANANVVPALIPPMRRITNLTQHVSQITGENLPKLGGQNEQLFNALMGKYGKGGGLEALPV